MGKERFIRGSVKSLGKEYTKERIRERIELKRERKATIPKRDYASRRLVDTSDEKFQNAPGLKRWATIENLKIAAQNYAEAESISKLEHEIAVKTEAGKVYGYIYVDGTLYNETLLAKGLAELRPERQNVDKLDILVAAQIKARHEGLGIWKY